MSTTNEEVTIDLEEAERKEGEKAAPFRDPNTKDMFEAAEDKPEPKKVEVSPEEGLEKLKKQLEDEKSRAESERAARIAAENDAQEARAAEAKARGDAQGSQLDMVKQAISTATQNKEVLKQRLRDARAAGDVDGESDVVDAMAENASNLATLKQAQQRLESAPKPVVRPRIDPVDDFASQIATNGFPKSAAWVRQHSEYVTDPAKRRKMMAAHDLALADGLIADSDEYLSSIEETLKIKKAPVVAETHDDPTADAASRPAEKQGRAASAPVARSGSGTNGTGNGARQRTMTLTPEQREAAAISGVTDEEYAINLMAINKGKMN
jgi:hypothetical protein